jgi:glycosyltransferase 2 family protein
MKRSLSLLNRILRIAVSVGLLAWVGFKTDWAEVRASFADIRLEFWVAAVGLLIVTQIVSAVRWKFYVDRFGMSRSLTQLTGFYFIGTFFNLLLPTSVGGDVVRVWYLDGQTGRRLQAFASVFLDRLNGLLVLMALACLAVTFSPQALPPWVTFSVWGIAACGVLGMIGLQILAGMHRLSPKHMEQLRTALSIFSMPRILTVTLALSLFVQAANVAIVWLIGRAIHAPIPGTYFWVLVPMVSLLTLLPISVNGMGVREKAMVLFLAPLGIAEGTALTLSMLWFAVCAAVSLLGGAVYYLGHFPKPETPVLPAREVTHESIRGDSDQGRTGQHQRAA